MNLTWDCFLNFAWYFPPTDTLSKHQKADPVKLSFWYAAYRNIDINIRPENHIEPRCLKSHWTSTKLHNHWFRLHIAMYIQFYFPDVMWARPNCNGTNYIVRLNHSIQQAFQFVTLGTFKCLFAVLTHISICDDSKRATTSSVMRSKNIETR